MTIINILKYIYHRRTNCKKISIKYTLLFKFFNIFFCCIKKIYKRKKYFSINIFYYINNYTVEIDYQYRINIINIYFTNNNNNNNNIVVSYNNNILIKKIIKNNHNKIQLKYQNNIFSKTICTKYNFNFKQYNKYNIVYYYNNNIIIQKNYYNNNNLFYKIDYKYLSNYFYAIVKINLGFKNDFIIYYKYFYNINIFIKKIHSYNFRGYKNLNKIKKIFYFGLIIEN